MLVEHTARFFLLDKDSNVILSYAHETPLDAILDDVVYLIENNDEE